MSPPIRRSVLSDALSRLRAVVDFHADAKPTAPTGRAVENSDEYVEEFSQLPADEALALLRALTSTYGRYILRGSELLTEQQRHYMAHGHRLEHGCCRDKRIG